MAELKSVTDIRAERVRRAYGRWLKADAEWIEATLDLAQELYAARQEHTSDNAFGTWLEQNGLKDIHYHDRAALIDLGANRDIAKQVLTETRYRKLRSIRDEMKARFYPEVKPESEQPQPQTAETVELKEQPKQTERPKLKRGRPASKKQKTKKIKLEKARKPKPDSIHARDNLFERVAELQKHPPTLEQWHKERVQLSLIPWLSAKRISDDSNKMEIVIDEQLRDICDGLKPRPEAFDGLSLSTFLRRLRTEITRRRKENEDERMKRNWNPENILRREQTAILNWIEEQLDKVPEY